MFEQKDYIICPICGKRAPRVSPFPTVIYRCDECDFISTDSSCVDVSYKDMFSAPLSNLYPHHFHIAYPAPACRGYDPYTIIHIHSMESFLQSLKIKDIDLQINFMTNYVGMDAKKMGMVLDGWKENQLLYFAGRKYERESQEYTDLITRAYDALFKTNHIFREIVLPKFKGYNIIHTIESDSRCDTVLTEAEFRYQISRLISKLED